MTDAIVRGSLSQTNIYPAVIAHAAATSVGEFEGCFPLGAGSGGALARPAGEFVLDLCGVEPARGEEDVGVEPEVG